MAITMQKKILDALEKKAEELQLEFVQNAGCSNIGTIHLMQDFHIVLAFDYDFQQGYSTIKLGRKTFFLDYKKDMQDQMKDLLTYITMETKK